MRGKSQPDLKSQEALREVSRGDPELAVPGRASSEPAACPEIVSASGCASLVSPSPVLMGAAKAGDHASYQRQVPLAADLRKTTQATKVLQQKWNPSLSAPNCTCDVLVKVAMLESHKKPRSGDGMYLQTNTLQKLAVGNKVAAEPGMSRARGCRRGCRCPRQTSGTQQAWPSSQEAKVLLDSVFQPLI